MKKGQTMIHKTKDWATRTFTIRGPGGSMS